MRLYKKLKKPWASAKSDLALVRKELKRQFPNFKFTVRYTTLSLLVLVGYLIHLNNFFTTKPAPQLVPISFASLVLASDSEQQALPVEPRVRKDTRIIVPVLMYHYIQNAEGRDGLTQDLSVRPEILASQLNYLLTHSYTTISPEELYRAIVNEQPLPAKPIMLTFDDGYGDFYTQAYPILKKYQVKATNFVPIGLVDRPYYLTTRQLKELNSDPLITIASHTLHHPDLIASTSESAWDEINSGKKKLEEVLGREVKYFAYPYGGFNNSVVEMVKKSGFKMAFSTKYGVEHTQESLLLQPRVRVGGSQSLGTFTQLLP